MAATIVKPEVGVATTAMPNIKVTWDEEKIYVTNTYAANLLQLLDTCMLTIINQ